MVHIDFCRVLLEFICSLDVWTYISNVWTCILSICACSLNLWTDTLGAWTCILGVWNCSLGVWSCMLGVRQTEGQEGGRTDRRTDRRADGQTKGRTDEWAHGRTGGSWPIPGVQPMATNTRLMSNCLFTTWVQVTVVGSRPISPPLCTVI